MAKHAADLGPYQQWEMEAVKGCAGSSGDAAGGDLTADEGAIQHPFTNALESARKCVVDAAMQHVNTARFSAFASDADLQRSKSMASAVLKEAGLQIKQLLDAEPNAKLSDVVEQIVGALDAINSSKLESGHRRQARRDAGHPEVKVYARKLGVRKGAVKGSKARRDK